MIHVNTKGKMDVRIIAGGVILMGAVLLGNWPEAIEDMSPTMVRTVGAAVNDCNSRSVNTSIGRLGCAKSKAFAATAASELYRLAKEIRLTNPPLNLFCLTTNQLII